MNYDFILNYTTPFIAQEFNDCIFDSHQHCEIEIIYCLEDSFNITINQQEYEVKKNQFVIIESMAPHSAKSEKTHCLLLRIGPTFLKESFSLFASLSFPTPIFSLENASKDYLKKIKACFFEISENLRNPISLSKLIITKSLYELSLCILANTPDGPKTNQSQFQNYIAHQKIENVLNYVYSNYSSQITIEDAARVAGYSKENFCTTFKLITGKTFHSFLNSFRIDQAKYLLTNTTLSIGTVSAMVGFNELKTFGRIFKEATHMTASNYKKQYFTH